MPELPEVETTKRGIAPYVTGHKVTEVLIRVKKLRWPIPNNLNKYLSKQTFISTSRRAKYLLLKNNNGHLVIHLGMSGSLRITEPDSVAEKHDHLDIVFDQHILRFRDPRKFGAILWTSQDPLKHKLLKSLGPEPLDDEFNADYLYQCSRHRKISIKEFIMNSHIVVGVGNIYATEALFNSGIHPTRSAGNISHTRYLLLVDEIKQVLTKAIESGGTSLRDFTREDGKPGYFQQELNVYGRAKLPCVVCSRPLRAIKQGQRTTTYCTQCQN